MKLRTVFLSLFTVFILYGPAGAQFDQNSIRDLVQMPVAVGKAAEAGVPEADLNRLSGAMIQGQVSPSMFNSTFQSVLKEGDLVPITDVGMFANQKLNEGFRGERLANMMHMHLQTNFGIPAGGTDVQGPPPIARNFISQEAMNNIQQQRPEISERSMRQGRSNSEERSATDRSSRTERSLFDDDSPGRNSPGRMHDNRRFPGGTSPRRGGSPGRGGPSGGRGR